MAGAPSAAAYAPGPAAGAPPADIIFTLAAPRAELSSQALVLADVAPVVQSFTHMGETEVFSTGAVPGHACQTMGNFRMLPRQYFVPGEVRTGRVWHTGDRCCPLPWYSGKQQAHPLLSVCWSATSSYEVEAAWRGAEAFANSSAHGIFVSASGVWLHDPVAVLKAMSGEQSVSALVALTEPAYDASARTLTFQVRPLRRFSLPLVVLCPDGRAPACVHCKACIVAV